MYGTQIRPGAAAHVSATEPHADEDVPLNERLAGDGGGALRDELLDELAVAAVDIEVALGRESDAAQAQMLRNLLQAVRLGEGVVAEAWNSLHG
jgi:hypothetical protein